MHQNQFTSGCSQRQPVQNRRAFTLIELLVVIGIIALLISILLPTLSKARRQAQSVECSSNLRQIGLMVQFYANDWQDALPPQQSMMLAYPNVGTYLPWYYVLAPYVGLNISMDNLNETTQLRGGKVAIFHCPSQFDEYIFQNVGIRYAANPFALPSFYDSGGQRLYFQTSKLAKVTRPTERVLIADIMDVNVRRDARLNYDPMFLNNTYPRDTFKQMQGWGYSYDTPPSDRHNGGSNVLSFDGSVRGYKFEELHCYGPYNPMPTVQYRKWDIRVP